MPLIPPHQPRSPLESIRTPRRDVHEAKDQECANRGEWQRAVTASRDLQRRAALRAVRHGDGTAPVTVPPRGEGRRLREESPLPRLHRRSRGGVRGELPDRHGRARGENRVGALKPRPSLHTTTTFESVLHSSVSKVMGLSPPHSHSVLVHNLHSSVSSRSPPTDQKRVFPLGQSLELSAKRKRVVRVNKASLPQTRHSSPAAWSRRSGPIPPPSIHTTRQS